jgi:hypothetical protein
LLVVASLDLSRSQEAGVGDLPSIHAPEVQIPIRVQRAMNKAVFASMPQSNGETDYMTAPPDETMKETTESMINGEANQKHLDDRRKQNKELPYGLQHKTLTDVWKKETPCGCPFNQWKPVCGVDGNTYPTECFAQCIFVDIFVHADCKYVKKEIWAHRQKMLADGRIDNEMCTSGDDDGDDDRPKCTRQQRFGDDENGPLTPHPEESEPAFQNLHQEDSEQVSSFQNLRQDIPVPSVGLRGVPTSTNVPQQEQEVEEKEEKTNAIEWRTIGGMTVPYSTEEAPNPCPQCPLGYTPVCGVDAKTYPNTCWADDCFGVQVAHQGECAEEN